MADMNRFAGKPLSVGIMTSTLSREVAIRPLSLAIIIKPPSRLIMVTLCSRN